MQTVIDYVKREIGLTEKALEELYEREKEEIAKAIKIQTRWSDKGQAELHEYMADLYKLLNSAQAFKEKYLSGNRVTPFNTDTEQVAG